MSSNKHIKSATAICPYCGREIKIDYFLLGPEFITSASTTQHFDCRISDAEINQIVQENYQEGCNSEIQQQRESE